MVRRGLGLVISSPSGAGKSSLVSRLCERDNLLSVSISVTTRQMRAGEQDGKDYYFIERLRYDEMARKGELLEFAEVFGHGYGTPRAEIEAQLKSGRDIVFDIDWQGHRQLKESMGKDLVSIFLLPPSMKELRNRLENRAKDSQKVINQRMAKAAREISHAYEYDWVFENQEIETVVEMTECVIKSERERYCRNILAHQHVQNLMDER